MKQADALNAEEPGSASVFPMDGYHYDDLVLVPRGLRPRKGARRAKVAMDGEVLRMPPPLVFRTAPRPLRLLVPSPAPAPAYGAVAA